MKTSAITLGKFGASLGRILGTVAFSVLALVGSVSEAKETGHSQIAKTYAAPPTPLCMAIIKGDVEIVKKFIEYGADIHEKSNGMTPLMLAARYNRVDIAKLLVEKGAKITTKSDNGFTALQWAEASGSKEVIEFLKNHTRKA